MGGLQHSGEAPIIVREVVSREIERSRDVSLLEEDRRTSIKD